MKKLLSSIISSNIKYLGIDWAKHVQDVCIKVWRKRCGELKLLGKLKTLQRQSKQDLSGEIIMFMDYNVQHC